MNFHTLQYLLRLWIYLISVAKNLIPVPYLPSILQILSLPGGPQVRFKLP